MSEAAVMALALQLHSLLCAPFTQGLRQRVDPGAIDPRHLELDTSKARFLVGGLAEGGWYLATTGPLPSGGLPGQIERIVCQASTPQIAVAAICQLVATTLGTALEELEAEQTELMTRRRKQGLQDLARENALRARTHHRDRWTVNELLAGREEPDV